MPISHVNHRRDRQRAVKMREQVAAASRFPFQIPAEPPRVDGQHNQVRLTGKMLLNRTFHLMPGRKMDESVPPVVRRSSPFSSWSNRFPDSARADFVDDVGWYNLFHASVRFTSTTRQRVVWRSLANGPLAGASYLFGSALSRFRSLGLTLLRLIHSADDVQNVAGQILARLLLVHAADILQQV